ncbi:MAG: ABC transporter permease [Spirochaetales bacterium]|uniref:ABC transporter permease n=1 Tax=Candidatus Thalassospirochaeta sargassi TaxID=3119039 RepID=A0AAJ1IIF7_9SPIO|nr:ABC transporter permease [Spirochaetales bacterium]
MMNTAKVNASKWIGRNIWIWAALGSLVMWVLIGAVTGRMTMGTLITNATLASFLILLSMGQMTVITSGEGSIDLSIQYTVALSAYVSSVLMVRMGIVPGLIITLAICALIGIINGTINMYLKVPAMITTLAMGFIIYSAVLMISTHTTGMPVMSVSFFTQKLRVFGVSPLNFIAIIISVLMWVLLYKTQFGKHLHAAGQNRLAAELAGVRIVRTVFKSFILSSVLAGFTGTLLGGYFGGAFQDMGLSYLLTSIAAPVIGGTSVAGGKSSVAGTFFGALFLTLLVALLNVSRLPASAQNLIQGGLLIVVLVASVPKKQTQNV